MNRKKKKWTTKNTHIERKKKGIINEVQKTPYDTIIAIIVISAAILSIIVIALDNHIVGYDNFIGIPREWVRSLFK